MNYSLLRCIFKSYFAICILQIITLRSLKQAAQIKIKNRPPVIINNRNSTDADVSFSLFLSSSVYFDKHKIMIWDLN